MYKKLIKNITISTVTLVMVVTSTTMVTYAETKDTEKGNEEIQIIDSTLIEDGILTENELQEEEIPYENEEVEISEENEINKDSAEPFEDKIPSDQPLKDEVNEEYYIKDEVLREIINKRLYKEEGHNPTPSELENITYLTIAPNSATGFNSKNYLRIESFEGIEYLVNLSHLIIQNVIMPESALENISSITSIRNLYIEYSFFTGSNDVSITLANTSINGAPRENVELSFSSYVSFEPLSNLSNLKQVQITRNGTIYDGSEFGKALTGYDLTGWEKLTELDYIWIEGASSFNDNSLEFVKSLPKLTEITLYNTSLNSVEHFADLSEDNIQLLQLMSNDVKDYTPVIDKKFFKGTSSNIVKDILEFYEEKEVNGEYGKYISVNTGIKVKEGLEDVSLSSYSMFKNSMEYLGYENIDGYLYLNFKLKDLVNFRYYSIDELYHGFAVVVELSYNTVNGTRKLEFELPINIGKRVDFVLSEDDIQSSFFKPFELIEPMENPTRPGYEFIRWTEDKEGTLDFDFSKETFDNQVVYAMWESIYVGKMYNLEANDGIINISELNELNGQAELEEKIIEVTQAKGYKIEHDGTQTELQVFVKALDNIVFDENGNSKDIELTLVNPNTRLTSSDDINEVNVTVKVSINNDLESIEEPSKPGHKPITPEEGDTSDKPEIPEENNIVNSPNTAVSNNWTNQIALLGVSIFIIIACLKTKKRYN